ncbi:L-threonylcarbamoyladenylate synthase [Lyngbya confervoides]|uniref:L-threonylcarbamoyladenylate synthase n=1 Tax=Lyngbya confervoides BDU141951 TaxID=1574623 RepID=A0ABD4SZB3_9CYAN|nr:L-threonylcarbamoyladenylate synthase [Lyngbya confervoides]MCM1981812.1 L-threonylcarbamoyladenylate synthase [Lyngbya confervoides BDU141951]
MPQLSMAALVALARSGSLISFPTDTVPALAVLPDHASNIYQAKQRSAEKPLILMAASPAELWPFVQGSPADLRCWQTLAQQFWPGALTLVLPASPAVPLAVHPHTPDTIGIRVPDQILAQAILQQTGPLATTSINRSGQSALTQPDLIEAHFPQVFTLDHGHWPPPGPGLPSTVIAWNGQPNSPSPWDLLRPGHISLEQIFS